MRAPRILSLILGSAALLPAVPTALKAADPLADGFRTPPPSARPHTWWHWMNGNISRAGITADLEAMQRFGLGGAQLFNVGLNIPPGPVQFMSPEWRELFKFAVTEAGRLGLELGVHNSAGWSGSGGPWITPENSMMQITTSEVRVRGPVRFDERLPRPPGKLDHYRDLAVQAFPTPPGEQVRYRDLHPVVTANSPGDPRTVADGDTKTDFRFPYPTPGQPRHLTVAFDQPFRVRTVRLLMSVGYGRCAGSIQASDDGHDFRVVYRFDRRWPRSWDMVFGLPDAVEAKYWRIQFEGEGRGRSRVLGIAELELLRQTQGDDPAGRAGFVEKPVHDLPVPDVPASDVVQLRDIVDLTARMGADGHLEWDVPAGEWTIVRTGYTPTGALNRPAPAAGTGLECDKHSRAALDAHWAGFMEKILSDAGPLAGRTFRNVLIDSWEVRAQNWSASFAAEFERRRGYDPRPFLPVFTRRMIDRAEITDRFLWDVRRTVADVMAENYYGRFAELAHRHGLQAWAEPYGGPVDSLQSSGPLDVVMGEFWMGREGTHPVTPDLKLASSAAHIYGRTFVAAEAFTTSAEDARWLHHPQTLKAVGDAAFCRGINRLVLHTYAHQPWPGRQPGMTMSMNGTEFARTTTWFEPGRAWTDYLARCQFLLQQGRFVADVAYFTGENAPVELRAGNPATPWGHDFDGVSAGVLRTAKVVAGRLVLASDMSYAVLVLPAGDTTMQPATLREIRRLVADGLTVIGPRPVRSPSLQDYPRCDDEVRRLAADLWGKCDGRTVKENPLGLGRIVWGRGLDEVLATLRLSPDVVFPARPEATVSFIHRTTGEAEIYFLAYGGDQPLTADYTFRIGGRQPELWHADTGVIEPAPFWRQEDGRTTVRLELEPAGSVFVVFRGPAPADSIASLAHPGAEPPTLSVGEAGATLTAWAPGDYTLVRASGRQEKISPAAAPAPFGLNGPWQVSFPPALGAPAQVSLPELVSWTDHTDPGVKYFSGTATYTQEFEVPADRLGVGCVARLDLGRVRNLAEVRLNGRDLGVWWKAPFRADVTAALRPGRNRLELKVTNLWANRLIGDEQLPADCEWNADGSLKSWPQWLLDGQPSPTGRVTFTTWHHWTKDSPLQESGLLGPVRIEFGTRHNLRISE